VGLILDGLYTQGAGRATAVAVADIDYTTLKRGRMYDNCTSQRNQHQLNGSHLTPYSYKDVRTRHVTHYVSSNKTASLHLKIHHKAVTDESKEDNSKLPFNLRFSCTIGCREMWLTQPSFWQPKSITCPFLYLILLTCRTVARVMFSNGSSTIRYHNLELPNIPFDNA
jgi:hypothetical protein